MLPVPRFLSLQEAGRQFSAFTLVAAQPWGFSLRVRKAGPGPLPLALSGLQLTGQLGEEKLRGTDGLLLLGPTWNSSAVTPQGPGSAQAPAPVPRGLRHL